MGKANRSHRSGTGPGSLRRDIDAGSQVMTFLVAGLAFSAVLGALFLYTTSMGRRDTVNETQAGIGRDRDAGALLSALLDQPGQGWATGVDGVSRVGLANATGAGLDASKVLALGSAWDAAAGDGELQGAEIARSLGLDPSATQFKLTLRTLANRTTLPDQHTVFPVLRTAYIGDWQSLVTVTVSPGTPAAMEASARASIDTRMLAGAASDRAVLAALGLNFTNRVYITTLPTINVDYPNPLPDLPLTQVLNVPWLDGDVYPDDKTYINANLPGRLSLYNVLVVGSNVDHNSLTSAVAKNAIAAWVNAGGTLIVLGSTDASSVWMQPIFSLSVDNHGTGTPTAPMAGYGMLNLPYALDYTNYNHGSAAWSIGSGDYAKFDHVVTAGAGSTSDIMAVSKDGAFGTGRLTLTTNILSLVVSQLGQTEGEHYLTNIILNLAAPVQMPDLNVTLGSDPPSNVPVASASQAVLVNVPYFGFQPMEATLLVWNVAPPT